MNTIMQHNMHDFDRTAKRCSKKVGLFIVEKQASTLYLACISNKRIIWTRSGRKIESINYWLEGPAGG